MKVKIGNNTYDASEEPIMIIFDEGETDRIGRMGTESSKYCSYPAEGYSEKEIEEFMEYDNNVSKLMNKDEAMEHLDSLMSDEESK